MTGNAVMLLPTDGDSANWSEQEKALVEAAGLVRTEGRGPNAQKLLADRPTVEAFLQHCRRTQLDPIARQIYAIYRAGKWGIQISIDGARLVAERTGKYRGQTTPEYTSDGKVWTEVWLDDEPPKAARVGVYHSDFAAPLYAVALWSAYAVYQDEWVDNRKTGKQTVSAMWKKMGPLMLAKCAEMLALRKAFPQDLSGLYSTEEMDQAGGVREVVRQAEKPAQAPAAIAAPSVTRDWKAEADELKTVEALTELAQEAERDGEIGLLLPDSDRFVIDVLRDRRKEIERAAAATPPLVDDEPKPARAAKRNWQQEARALTSQAEAFALVQEATAAGVPVQVIEELESIARKLPDAQEAATATWAVAEIPADEPWTPEVPSESVAEVVPEAGETVIP